MGDVTIPNMGLVQPSNGGSSGTWGTKVNENTAKLDVHDHTPGLGAKVPVLGLDIDDDLSFGGEFAPIHLHHLTFDQIAVSPGAGSFFIKQSDHELYYLSIGSAEIKISNGSSLNVAAFTGGFIGDVTLMKPSYDNGVNQYKFTDLLDKRAVIQCGSVQLVEFNAAISTSVTLQSPAALAGSYTIQMPAAVPGSTSVVQMSSSGVLTASNTIVNDVTMTANKSVVVSGTGDYKHGTKTMLIPVTTPQSPALSTPAITINPGSAGATVGIPIAVGRTIVAIRAIIKDNVTGPTKLVVSLSTATAGSALSNVATGSASAGSGATQTITVSGLSAAVIAGSVYYATIVASAGSASCTLYALEVDYTCP